MFRSYCFNHALEIQRAAEINDWDKVNTLYNIKSQTSHYELGEAICNGVIKNTLFKSEQIDTAEQHLLRALTLGPVTIKLPLIERLRSIPLFAELEAKNNFITRLAETAADIYTVMFAMQSDYQSALEHINKGNDIPREEALTLIVKKLMTLS